MSEHTFTVCKFSGQTKIVHVHNISRRYVLPSLIKNTKILYLVIFSIVSVFTFVLTSVSAYNNSFQIEILFYFSDAQRKYVIKLLDMKQTTSIVQKTRKLISVISLDGESIPKTLTAERFVIDIETRSNGLN